MDHFKHQITCDKRTDYYHVEETIIPMGMTHTFPVVIGVDRESGKFVLKSDPMTTYDVMSQGELELIEFPKWMGDLMTWGHNHS